MSTIDSPQTPTGAVGDYKDAKGTRWLRRIMIVSVTLLIGVGGMAATGYAIGVNSLLGDRGQSTGAPISDADPTSRAMVTKQTLSARIRVDGTLGYADGYTVVNQASGTVTALPDIGQVVSRGEPLYNVDATAVVLLYGQTPAYRTLSEGMTGPDVAQLNVNLVALGFSSSAELASSDAFTTETAAALEKLKAKLGYPIREGLDAAQEARSLAFGQAVFLPSAARITSTAAVLGAPAQPGAPFLQATSTTRQVIVDLRASQQTAVAIGDQVAVTLADDTVTPGRVSSVGKVASSSPGRPPTIKVLVTLDDPESVGSLDQAPVLVSITTASVVDALVVPVTALLARVEGGYAIEVADADGTHRMVSVTLGLFDGASGLVQITGPDVRSGQQVVVPGL